MVTFNVHGQVMGTFACHAPLNTLIVHTPENNQHLKVLIWGGGRGGLRISTLCTNGKMLTIVNGPLQSDEFNAISHTERISGSFEHKPLQFRF